MLRSLRNPEQPLPWYLRPEPKPADIRDNEEHSEVATALAALPEDHPAFKAYAEGLGTIALTHMVREYPTIVDALTRGLPCW